MLEAVQENLDFDEENVEGIKQFSDTWDHYKNNLFNRKVNEQFDLRRKINNTYKLF